MIDTGDLITEDYWLYSLEAAFARDNMILQAEYVQSIIPKVQSTVTTSGHQLQFNGWHIDAIWILSGEAQPYNQQKGTLGRLKPLRPVHKGGWGGHGKPACALVSWI